MTWEIEDIVKPHWENIVKLIDMGEEGEPVKTVIFQEIITIAEKAYEKGQVDSKKGEETKWKS